MTPEQWAQVKLLLDRSRAMAPTEYRAAVERTFPEAPEIWDEVLLLLQAATRSTEAPPTPGPARETAPSAAACRNTFVPGDVCGPYRVVRPIGMGGMGEVYLAEDLRTALPGMPIRRVALKCLTGTWLERPDARYRLLVEFAAAAALESHTHIAAAHDALEIRDGQLMVLVIEFVDGTPLNRMVANGPLPWRFAVELAAQVADGLEQAHLRNILHCDIKPANVMVTPKRTAKILDFGLSRAEQMPHETGPQLGTLAYMPPERIIDNVTNASGDLYSLGATLYEMLTGRRAFEADEQWTLMSRVLEVTPPPPSALVPGIPAAVDAATMRALAKNPGDRFQTAREFRQALRSAIEPRQRSVVELVLRWAAVLAGVLLLVSFIGAIGSRTIDIGLGRTEGFVGDVRRSALVWGAMSIVAPALFIAAMGVLAGAVAVVLRLVVMVVPPLRRIVTPVLQQSRRRLLSATASSEGAIGQGVLLLQGALLVGFAWTFWPLMRAVTHFGSPAFPGTLDALRPSNNVVHEQFRMYGTLLLLLLVVSWRTAQCQRPFRPTGTAIGGLLAIGIAVCLLFYPFQVLFHNSSERVTYDGAPCYLAARNDLGQARLFCPRAAGAERVRTIDLNDPRLARTGVVESVFAELDRTGR